ncbi:MAG: zinc ribbon domain-containing protein, partial [Clostridia bacterium]|nr:zinc ribbon domain-containing protein [Clostridia bacterium]
MICKNCGNKIIDGATVCDLCGAPVADASNEAMQPQENGTENIIKDPFWEQTKENNANNAYVKKVSNETKIPYDPFAPIANTESADSEIPKNDGTKQQKHEDKGNKEPSYDPFASYANSTNSNPANGNEASKESKVQLNRNAIILLSIAIIIIIAVVAVIVIFSKTTKNNKAADTNIIQYSDTVTDEKSNYDNEKKIASPEIDMARVNTIIDKDTHNAAMSVCIIDLTTGKEFKTSNADRAMSASAMINIPILYAADNLVKNNGNRLDNIDVRFHYSTSGRSFMEKDQDGNVYDLYY